MVQAQGVYNPAEIEKEIENYWRENNIYDRLKKEREKGERYYFVDGPPYTSGNVHIGTAWNKILKDLYVRFRRMQGYNVRDQPGFDMHGLPIEVLVEKSMNISNKRDIEKIGINKFVKKCREFALKNMEKMIEQFRALGVWLDWEHPYTTITNEYIEAAWWTIKKAHEQGLLVEAERVIPWCPRCETALAEAEIRYWDEEDYSIYVKFPLREVDNEYIIIWTTTPWTIPGNLAVAVHPEYVYVRVRVGNETYIILEDTYEDVLREAGIEEYEVIERFGGSQLVGKKYIHPLRGAGIREIGAEWAYSVLLFDGVEKSMSGVVHIAPGHGPEDFELGKEYELPPFCPVDERGIMSEDAGKYKGMSVSEASEAVIKDLESHGLLLSRGTIVHRYGHCWRCRNKIIYRSTKQWFIKVTEIKDNLLEEVERVSWTPPWAGSARQKDWVENAKDWCISRQRYWGIPLPIWRCENCGNTVVVGSISELKKLGRRKKIADLHRPWIDKVKIKCKKCKKNMYRVPDVLDVWFDSAVCSWAQLGFPGYEDDFKKWWPVRWIVEAHDQTRGWFYSQLCAGVIAFNRCPYDEVLMHGFALDEKGRPMSKSLGNVIDPMEVIREYGVDALRLYLLHASAPWEDLPFSLEGVRNARRTLNILWNCYTFAKTYMALDAFSADYSVLEKNKMDDVDRWVLSRFERAKKEFLDFMEKYHVHKAARIIEEFFVEDLSRWYIRLIKDRVWIEESDGKKVITYNVLHYILSDLARLMAPMVPYISEHIFRGLGHELSVHLETLPRVREEFLDEELEKNMAVVRDVVEAIASSRQKIGRGLRWPIRRAVVIAKDEGTARAIEHLQHIVKKQGNIKEIKVVRPGEQWDEMILSIKPNMNAIGPVFRQWAPKIARILENADPNRVKEHIEKGAYVIGVEGQRLKVTPDMVEFEYRVPEQYTGFEFSGGKLYLDTTMDREIEGEGFAREIVRRIQQMRKDCGLEVEDYIECQIKVSDRVAELIEPYAEWIAGETRAELFEIVSEISMDGYTVEWNVAGENITICIVQVVIEYEEAEEAGGAEEEAPTEAKVISAEDEAKEVFEKEEEEDVEEISEVVEEGVVEEEKGKICPLCGYRVEDDVRTCPRCGTVLEEEGVEGLREGFTYLYIGESLADAYRMFAAEARRRKALCISREAPKKLEKLYGISGNIIWLTEIDGENTIKPRDLEKISLVVEQFSSENRGGIIMLDGVEYLAVNNTFISVLKLIQALRDLSAINNTTLLIPILKDAFEKHQINMLEREVDGVLSD